MNLENKNGVSLFKRTAVESASAIARDTIKVVRDSETGIVSVEFALASGKGTGKQTVPVAEFRNFTAALKQYSEEGINKTTGARSSVDMLHSTIALDEDQEISFRCSTGKGAKPTHLPVSELPGVVDFLSGLTDRIEAEAKKLGYKPE